MAAEEYSWHLTADLDEFTARAREFLHSAPVLHTVHLGVTDTLRRRGLDFFRGGAPVFGLLTRGQEVRGTMFRTPPHRLNLTPLTGEPGAVEALVRVLADTGLPDAGLPDAAPSAAGHPGARVPGVASDAATAHEFAEEWSRVTGARSTRETRQRLYRLAALTPPVPAPPGRARLAGEADRELLADWYTGFRGSAGLSRGGVEPGAWADNRLSIGGAALWELPDGTPAAMACRGPVIAGQLRISPVYTPPELRRRGYAGAVTAALSRDALELGAEEVLLFTDLDNATSNALYQRIGYRPVRDFATYRFDG